MKARQHFGFVLLWVFGALVLTCWISEHHVQKIHKFNLSSFDTEETRMTKDEIDHNLLALKKELETKIEDMREDLVAVINKRIGGVDRKANDDSTYTRASTDIPDSLTHPPLPLGTYEIGKYMVNMTVVTAYFNIGAFKKAKVASFTPALYHTWSAVFKRMRNPLVIYTDSIPFQTMMQKIRENDSKLTKIIFVKREDLWSFAIINRIKRIYSNPKYPKHHPNTVIPEYSSAQHSKYAVVADAIRRNYFHTELYCWLDIGYFRHMVKKKKDFVLIPPPDLKTNRLAVNRVFSKPSSEPSIQKIFRSNLVWVGGGLFIGTRETLLKFEFQYKQAVLFFLDKGEMNTDQQVLYAMYSKQGRKDLKPETELQLYIPTGKGNRWFYLGYQCYKEL